MSTLVNNLKKVRVDDEVELPVQMFVAGDAELLRSLYGLTTNSLNFQCLYCECSSCALEELYVERTPRLRSLARIGEQTTRKGLKRVGVLCKPLLDVPLENVAPDASRILCVVGRDLLQKLELFLAIKLCGTRKGADADMTDVRQKFLATEALEREYMEKKREGELMKQQTKMVERCLSLVKKEGFYERSPLIQEDRLCALECLHADKWVGGDQFSFCLIYKP